MLNHEDTVRRHIIHAISKCKRITPGEREKRTKKIAEYMKEEQEREDHPEQRAKTRSDLQEQVQRLQEDNARMKRQMQRKPRWKKR